MPCSEGPVSGPVCVVLSNESNRLHHCCMGKRTNDSAFSLFSPHLVSFSCCSERRPYPERVCSWQSSGEYMQCLWNLGFQHAKQMPYPLLTLISPNLQEKAEFSLAQFVTDVSISSAAKQSIFSFYLLDRIIESDSSGRWTRLPK